MTIGASAVAGLRALGGSYAVNHNAVQFFKPGVYLQDFARYGDEGAVRFVRRWFVPVRFLNDFTLASHRGDAMSV